MNTALPNELPPDIKMAMEKAVHFALTGEAEPDFLRQVRVEADRVRDEVFRKHGILDIGVPAIRSLRDDDE